MADRYYGVDLGGGMPGNVTEAGSTTSKVIELRVTYTTSGMTKVDVLKAIEALENYVATDTWPPA